MNELKMHEIELERTFLAKQLPDDLLDCESKKILDIYIPEDAPHPNIRIRKSGNKFSITKKQPINNKDFSKQTEQTIPITEQEFIYLSNNLKGKRLHKIRYYYKYKVNTAEIDVFLDDLKGLALVDFEFSNEQEKNNFLMPDFCLVDVTQEDFVAGGLLAGKRFKDVEERLMGFGYSKILV